MGTESDQRLRFTPQYMALLSSSLSLFSLLTSLFSLSLNLALLCSLRASKPKNTNTMLLGKRQRPPIKRTTSLSEIKFDLNLPGEPAEPSDDQIQIPSSRKQLTTVDEHRQVHHERLLAMVSPRGAQRRHSADYSAAAGDFLRSCSLCERHLVPGRDIYMYRGDRAFCSLECRQQQITVDERKEKASVGSTVVVAAGSAKGERVSAAV